MEYLLNYVIAGFFQHYYVFFFRFNFIYSVYKKYRRNNHDWSDACCGRPPRAAEAREKSGMRE